MNEEAHDNDHLLVESVLISITVTRLQFTVDLIIGSDSINYCAPPQNKNHQRFQVSI